MTKASFILLFASALSLAAVSPVAQAYGQSDAPQTVVTEPVGSEQRPVRVSGGVIATQVLHKEDPIYPEEAKSKGVSGAVVMMATLDRDGKVSKLAVVSGPEDLRDAALEAVHQWTYKPYRLNGNPVFVQTTITVNFSLSH